SIEDAQADRARRKADREGLRRPVQPEEPAPAKPAKKTAAKKASATKSAAPETAPEAEDATPDGDGGGRVHAPVRSSGPRLVTSRSTHEAPTPAPAPAAK